MTQSIAIKKFNRVGDCIKVHAMLGSSKRAIDTRAASTINYENPWQALRLR